MEENKKDEKVKEEVKKPEAKITTSDSKEGGKYETTPIIERAREEREKMEAVVKIMKEENDRREQIMAKRALGGEAEAGQAAEKPKELTDIEYAEALERGEVNPLKEDGLM